jgi:ankyrin repeat protein
LAAETGHLEVLKWLKERCGVDVNVDDDEGEFPAHLAARNGHLEVLKWLKEQCGVDINVANDFGSRPTHIAARNGYLEVLKWLKEQCEVYMKEQPQGPQRTMSSNLTDSNKCAFTMQQ